MEDDMKKRFFRIIVLVIIASAVIFSVQWYREKENRIENGNLKIYGTIDIRDARLAFKEQERISAVLVEEGDRVEAGQNLARLDSERLKAQIAEAEAQIGVQQEVVKRLKSGSRSQEIDQARAEVEAARVMVHNDKQILDRLLKTSGGTSEQEIDDARSRLLVEQAQLEVKEKALNLALEGPRKEDIAAAGKRLEALQANLSLLQIRLEDMTLKAPTAGVIQSRILEPGEMADPTHPVFILALTDPKWVRAYIPEPELGRIRLGMKTSVVNDSFPGKSMDGWVGFISPIAEFTPRTVETEDLRTKLVYEIRVFVHDDHDLLRLGMPVTVIIDEKAPVKAVDEVFSSSENKPAAGE
jgi:multidrug resistance efflux pump